MFRSLRRLFRSSYPLSNANLGDRARDITFRVMEDDDIATCMGFYRANEAAHFPPGLYKHFDNSLRQRNFLTLVSLRNGTPVGCCGLHYQTNAKYNRIAVLCFGMVDPPHQRQGIGTAQLLVRLALLKTQNDLAVATMLAVPNSVPFYRRFGFTFEREAQGSDGGTYNLGVLRMAQSFIDDCRRKLAQRRIIFPDVCDQIPNREEPPARAA